MFCCPNIPVEYQYFKHCSIRFTHLLRPSVFPSGLLGATLFPLAMMLALVLALVLSGAAYVRRRSIVRSDLSEGDILEDRRTARVFVSGGGLGGTSGRFNYYTGERRNPSSRRRTDAERKTKTQVVNI